MSAQPRPRTPPVNRRLPVQRKRPTLSQSLALEVRIMELGLIIEGLKKRVRGLSVELATARGDIVAKNNRIEELQNKLSEQRKGTQ